MRDRPETRLNCTNAKWDRAAHQAADEMNEESALTPTKAFNSSCHSRNFGAQAEC
ncbi:hypothetical protein [Pseudomonas fulva]|uniref:hypothetical protein n=1 Tax=Pseudomonas fulva TaxID=47880 RepID=UPI003D9C44CB